MFWIYAAAGLVVLLVLARSFDRRRSRGGGTARSVDRDENSRARDEHTRHRLENPSGEHGPHT